MAKKLTAPPAATDATPVYLRSEDLGETRAFDADHAAALLALQHERGYDHWQQVATPDTADSK